MGFRQDLFVRSNLLGTRDVNKFTLKPWTHSELSGFDAPQNNPVRRARWERVLVQCQCQVFVASWTGVIRSGLSSLLCPCKADGAPISLGLHEALSP